MIKMKKYIFLIISLFCIELMNVEASPINDSCINDNTCMVLCNYVNTYTVGGSHSTGYQKQERTRNITIYYNFATENITVKWQSTNTDADVYSKGPNSFSNIFSTSGTNIYNGFDDDISINNFSCPANGYLDMSSLNGNNELCFDNDGTTCTNEYSGIGTSFGKGSDFVSQEKDYDYEEDIEAYIDGMFEHIKDDVSSGKYSGLTEEEMMDAMYEKMITDFKTNYLFGNSIPDFIANSEAYQSIYDNVEEEFNKTKQEALQDAEQDLSSGNITQEEYDNILNNWNQINVQNVVDGTTEALDFIKRDSVQNNLEWEANSCDSILGSTENPNEPAYYLNFAFNILKYAAIVVLFVFTILDFAKATTSDKDDALKKALQSTIKRIIICIIIFFLPTLINFVLSLLGVVDDPTCGIGVN